MLASRPFPAASGARTTAAPRTMLQRPRSLLAIVSLLQTTNACGKLPEDDARTAVPTTSATEARLAASVVNTPSSSTPTSEPPQALAPTDDPPSLAPTTNSEDERPRRSGVVSVAPKETVPKPSAPLANKVPPPAPPTSASKLATTLPQAGEGYRTYAQVSSPIVIGKDSTLTIHLDPQPPFKSNDKYPYRFTVTGSRGVTSSAQVVTAATITPTKTTLQLSLEGNAPGPGSLAGTFSFSVCTPEKCLVERTPLVLNFEVVGDALSASPPL